MIKQFLTELFDVRRYAVYLSLIKTLMFSYKAFEGYRLSAIVSFQVQPEIKALPEEEFKQSSRVFNGPEKSASRTLSPLVSNSDYWSSDQTKSGPLHTPEVLYS